MIITYLGHAGFIVETDDVILIMDPWLSEDGAFDGAWFQFPCNHHLQYLLQQKLSSTTQSKYIYLSHEHKDHFDAGFLKSIEAFDFTYIIPRFHRPALVNALERFTTHRIQLCSDSDIVFLNGGLIKIFADDGELNRDSAILVELNGKRFLNLNDCKIHDRLKEIVGDLPIDVFACQYSGATWHPTCYDYSREEYERVSLKKMRSKFEATAKAIETVRPDIFLPSAGPACFLDPDLIAINFEPINIFPRTNKLLDYLSKRLIKTPDKNAC
jgi:UDP-MurNAc hydroxylase